VVVGHSRIAARIAEARMIAIVAVVALAGVGF
jgi:hypothetical protein